MANYQVIDLHEDIAYYLMNSGRLEEEFQDFDADVPGRQSDIPKLVKGNIKVVFGAVFPIHDTYNPMIGERISSGYGTQSIKSYTPTASKAIGLEMIKIYLILTRRFSNRLRIIENYSDVEQVMNSDLIGLLMSVEGADMLDDTYDLLLLHRLGVRVLGITWNFDNRYGASCFTKKDYGLTMDGEELVKLANELGVIIDLAHASKNTMIDALNVARKPVIISHANTQGVHRHPRNVDDEVLELLARNHGVIGITMIPSTIGPRPNIDSLVKHILYIHERFGPDLIALGTDFLGIEKTPEDLTNIGEIGRLIDKLAGYGINDNDLRKITFENALRIIRNNL
ncbi:dipeptidase [Vulcanisaeta souniana]|uniref:Peptidase n=1 Tax=Vulcanisaeta souniana JCM 11219 TaxID=1293586 RepID=A0A830E8J9_9CREN|nr:membrane dipeptidase [Vulcanisaeta souniana]BDR92778.1 peptidase [Vulcanisaeta souniana JCM 11219]GGI82177.1 peptidase [Vulcanisaeta souniana JCM 11219]